MSEFAEKCRKRGLPITPQRLAIIRALLASGEHPRADRICLEVRRHHPRLSLATVHRTLEMFCRLGEARKVTVLHDSARYDGNVEPHHHVVCVRCHRIRDVAVPEFGNLLKGRTSFGEFLLLGCSVEIQAFCKRCLPRAAKALLGRPSGQGWGGEVGAGRTGRNQQVRPAGGAQTAADSKKSGLAAVSGRESRRT